ncbi:hypothetical protein TNCV_2281691 [Trichonephila clavipes]|nr:hypothetical protein TNCV_2281691 [Trichonephila clavipes]
MLVSVRDWAPEPWALPRCEGCGVVHYATESAFPNITSLLAKTNFVFKDFNTCGHEFLRVNAINPSLPSPYSGPCAVLKRKERHFQLAYKWKEECAVSINIIKPALLLK